MANPTPTTQPYPAAIFLATLSLLTLLLIQPPLLWHIRNRNLAATVLVIWLTILLLFNFINAIIWPNDNWDTWYHGIGLCDVEVKLQVASGVALPASLACILRALAGILDTERATVGETRKQRRRRCVVDCVWCVGLPMLQCLFHWFVQRKRYYIFGISGCTPYVGESWVAFVLIVVPPAIWVVVDVYFAVIILIRLYRYRLSISTILEKSNTTRSRFLRIYLFCTVGVVCAVPLETYIIYLNSKQSWHSYSWGNIHSPTMWDEVVLVKSDGRPFYNSWISLGFGILIFAFFGFGKEAVAMYRTCLLALRMDRIFPGLNPDYRNEEASTSCTFVSKLKRFFKRTGASPVSKTLTSGTPETSTSSKTDSLSPKTTTFLETLPQRMSHDGRFEETGLHRPSFGRHVASFISSRHSKEAPPEADALSAAEFSGDPRTVHSEVISGGDRGGDRSLEVVVKKEIRQGSEHAESVAATFYHAN